MLRLLTKSIRAKWCAYDSKDNGSRFVCFELSKATTPSRFRGRVVFLKRRALWVVATLQVPPLGSKDFCPLFLSDSNAEVKRFDRN